MEHNNCLHSINACVVIPTYNNCNTLSRVIEGTLQYTKDIIIVNDGSTDLTTQILQSYEGLEIIEHTINKGKGEALKSGFSKAVELGFDFALTIDSDGQHYPDDLPSFVNEILTNGEALLIGARNMDQEGVPKCSSSGNKISNFWYWFETGVKLSDTQSGFRIYPIKKLKSIKCYTSKYEFEIEIIVRASWNGIKVKNIPIKVLYDETERVSHFRPYMDFSRISLLNTVLVIISLLYIKPRDYLRKFKNKGFKRFFFEDLLHSQDTPLKKSFSVALGILIGLSPLWGFHAVTAIFLAVMFRLNKFIAFAFSNISLPPLIPFIVYAGCATGNFLLGNKEMEFKWDDFDSYSNTAGNHILEYIVGSIIFSIICSFLAGVVTYFILDNKKSKNFIQTHN